MKGLLALRVRKTKATRRFVKDGWLTLAFAATLLARPVATSARALTETVAVDTGVLKGVRGSTGILSFKRIPYAAAPVGDLRWRPPSPARAWSGLRDATAYGPKCWG